MTDQERHEAVGRLAGFVIGFVLTVTILSLAERFVTALERLASSVPEPEPDPLPALEVAPPPKSWRAARRARENGRPPSPAPTSSPAGDAPAPGPADTLAGDPEPAGG